MLEDNDPRRSDKSELSQFFNVGMPDISLLSQRNSRDAQMNIDEFNMNRLSGNQYRVNNMRPSSLQGYDAVFQSHSLNQQDI